MLKVLIVDDDEIIRLFLKKLLVKKFKFEVIEAANGIDGLEQLHNNQPDMVFLDITMPIMDGVEVLEAIRNDPHNKNMNVVIMTAVGDKVVVASLLRLGITDFLLKPLDYDSTADRLKKIIMDNPELAKKAFGDEVSDMAETHEKKKILITDRDPAFRKFIFDNFSHRFDIVEAPTGADCLRLFIDIKPKYVIIGEKLDAINEALLAKKIRELNSDIHAEIFLCAENTMIPAAIKPLFHGVIKKSFVADQFIAEFAKVVLGQGDVMETINVILQKQLREDVMSGLRQSFGLLAREDIDLLPVRDAGKIFTELSAKISFVEVSQKVPITFVLFGSKSDYISIARKIGGAHVSEDKLMATLKELLENVAERIKFSFSKRGVKLNTNSIEIEPNKMAIATLSWKMVLPFSCQTGPRFFIAALLN